jgi:hypothetical protein
MERLLHAFSFNEKEPLIFTQLDFWLFFLAVMIIFSAIHKNYLVRSFFFDSSQFVLLLQNIRSICDDARFESRRQLPVG